MHPGQHRGLGAAQIVAERQHVGATTQTAVHHLDLARGGGGGSGHWSDHVTRVTLQSKLRKLDCVIWGGPTQGETPTRDAAERVRRRPLVRRSVPTDRSYSKASCNRTRHRLPMRQARYSPPPLPGAVMLSDKTTEHICRLVDDSPPFTDDDLAALSTI